VILKAEEVCNIPQDVFGKHMYSNSEYNSKKGEVAPVLNYQAIKSHS